METIKFEVPYKIGAKLYKCQPPYYYEAELWTVTVRAWKDTNKVIYTLRIERTNSPGYDEDPYTDIENLDAWKESRGAAEVYAMDKLADEIKNIDYTKENKL